MSIEEGRRMMKTSRVRRARRAARRATDRIATAAARAANLVRLAPLLFGGALLMACTDGSVPADDTGAAAPTSEAISTPPQATAEAEAPATVADIFPEGEGRQLVLNNCATCHAVACAAMGQRPVGRWNELEEVHEEHLPGLSDQDRETIFAYLRENFSESRPEPVIRPEFLDRGCTPF